MSDEAQEKRTEAGPDEWETASVQGLEGDEDSTQEDSSHPAGIVALQPVAPGSLQKVDALRRYLWEVNRYKPLSAEEEHRLAVLRFEDGDQDAAYRLVTSNLRVVVKIAMMYGRVFTNVLDLIQEGNIGLMEAVKRFDPYKGTRLPTYASWWIKAYIIKFMLDNFRIVRMGTTNEKRKLLFGLKREKERLRLQGIEPTHRRIARALKVSEQAVRDMEASIEASDVSLDSFVYEGEPTRFVDTLPAAEERLEERLARGELQELFQEKLKEFARSLKEREQFILEKRLMAEEPMTLQDIAARYDVTREAIRLNEKTLVKKIKEHMKKELRGVTEVEFGLLD